MDTTQTQVVVEHHETRDQQVEDVNSNKRK